jgi:hypothetical protein
MFAGPIFYFDNFMGKLEKNILAELE